MNNTLRFSILELLKIPLVAGIAYGIWITRGFLLLLVLALIISTFIEDFVQRGKKYKIPRIVSVLAFYSFGIVSFVAVLYFILPVFGKEFLSLLEYSPVLAEAINGGIFMENMAQISSFSNAVDFAKNLSIDANTFRPLLSIFGGVFNLVIVFIISFYLSANEGIFKKLLLLLSPKKKQEKVIQVWQNIQKKIGSWFRGQLIIALLLVILTYIGLSLLGIPYSFLLSLLAGLFGLIPYGIFIALIPAISLTLSNNGWFSALLVIGMYLLIQQLLDYILQPIILKRMTGIPSLLVILSVIFGAKLFGFVGVLIAVPIALVMIELVSELQKQKGLKILEEDVPVLVVSENKENEK